MLRGTVNAGPSSGLSNIKANTPTNVRPWKRISASGEPVAFRLRGERSDVASLLPGCAVRLPFMSLRAFLRETSDNGLFRAAGPLLHDILEELIELRRGPCECREVCPAHYHQINSR